MPFPGERLAPRGSKKSWEIKKESQIKEFDMRVRAFTNGGTERLDIEVLENGNKRRIFTHDGPNAEIRGEGFVAGYGAGRTTLKALTPQAKSKTNKKATPEAVLKNATKFLVRFGTASSVLDMMRYDKCFPATEDDSRKLEKAQIGGGERTYMDHVIKFYGVSRMCPTRDRWASFGCEVLAVGEAATNKKFDELEWAQHERMMAIKAGK